jgi:hypothetical protein
LNQHNQQLLNEINEVKELLGLCESKDPTDRNGAHLKTLVRKLKQRNEILTEENK